MSKKNFSEGIDALLGNAKQKNPSVSKISQSKEKANSKTKETKLKSRTTLVLEDDLIEKLKALALWERSTIQETFAKAAELYLNSKDEKLMEEALKLYRAKKGK